MIQLRPDCVTNTSLRTFTVSAGLNEQAFQQTIVQDWPTSQYFIFRVTHGCRQWSSKTPTHFTNTHRVTSRQEQAMNAFPLATYIQLVRAGRSALVRLSFVSMETERKYFHHLQLPLWCPIWAPSKFLLNIFNNNHQCTVKVQTARFGQSDHYEADNYRVLMTTMKVTSVCGLQ
jgi:hypothetical protein